MTPRSSRLALPLAVLLALATASCSDASSTSGTPTSPTTTSQGGSVDKAEAVLKEQAVALRAVVDDLIEDDKERGGRTGNQYTPCAFGQQGRYPASWTYSWRLFLKTPDSRPTARAYADRLEQQGFSVSPFGDPDADDITLVAQKEGTRITLPVVADKSGMVKDSLNLKTGAKP